MSSHCNICYDIYFMPFYGVLRLPLRVRDVKPEEVFGVSRINEDAILEMPFLVAHYCAMEFNQLIVQIDGKKLKCTDRHCWLLVGSVPVTHELVVPPPSPGQRCLFFAG